MSQEASVLNYLLGIQKQEGRVNVEPYKAEIQSGPPIIARKCIALIDVGLSFYFPQRVREH